MRHSAWLLPMQLYDIQHATLAPTWRGRAYLNCGFLGAAEIHAAQYAVLTSVRCRMGGARVPVPAHRRNWLESVVQPDLLHAACCMLFHVACCSMLLVVHVACCCMLHTASRSNCKTETSALHMCTHVRMRTAYRGTIRNASCNTQRCSEHI